MTESGVKYSICDFFLLDQVVAIVQGIGNDVGADTDPFITYSKMYIHVYS